MPRQTAIFKDPLFIEHDPGFGHPESPDRLRVIYEMLAQPEQADKYLLPDCQPADDETLALNHTRPHIKRVADTDGKTFASLDPDTSTSPQSNAAARLAAGAMVQAVAMVASGKADNAFALVRPPGHHAEADRTSGFCLFNNIAVAAHYAIKHLGLKRILIVDWDLHHGNGTQHSFYDTDEVLYFSTHQYPYFPGTGAIGETGSGKGEGHTINVPLPGGQDDQAYARIFNELLVPVAKTYKPELILVSAGFDISLGDPLGAMSVSNDGFAYMTGVLRNLADEFCQGKMVLALEGGYDLDGLRSGVAAVLRELRDGKGLSEQSRKTMAKAAPPLIHLDQAIQAAKKYWPV
ncbi:MAG: histone deacetylase [Desulfuromonadales bacterium]|nr:histone deacetylase [Desulfuromonadales bacterium]